MYERSATERGKLPHRRQSLVKSTAMALGMSSLLWGGAAFADAPREVKIESLRWAGSGCPAGSVSPRVTPDSFRLLFEEYIASVGPVIPIKENRKNCNLILKLAFPAGWSFTIFRVDYRGYAYLDPNVTLRLRSAYFFEGGFPSPVLQATLIGPWEGEFEISDTLGLGERVWSPCGVNRALNINTEVRMSSNLNGSGLAEKLSHHYGLIWRRC